MRVSPLTPSGASERDLEALTFIGEGYEVAQYQLHAAVFRGLSATVVSRFVRRSVGRGLVVAERLHGIGFSRLRLTREGLRVLVECDISAETIFAPTRATPLKDLSHTLFISDLRVVLRRLPDPPDELLAAWAMARRGGGTLRAIPDLLATWQTGSGSRLAIACEVDLGAEPLQRVFLPKLRRLGEALPQAGRVIVVLTRGEKRKGMIQAAASSVAATPVLAFCLPSANGPGSIEELERIFLPAPLLEEEAADRLGRVAESRSTPLPIAASISPRMISARLSAFPCFSRISTAMVSR